MYIYIDENNMVYSTSQEELNEGIFIKDKDFLNLDNIYIYENGILNEYIRPMGVNIIFDFETKLFKDNATILERQLFWKTKMLEINNQIKDLQEIGLGGGVEEITLRKKLDEYRIQYMNATHEEAIEMDKQY